MEKLSTVVMIVVGLAILLSLSLMRVYRRLRNGGMPEIDINWNSSFDEFDLAIPYVPTMRASEEDMERMFGTFATDTRLFLMEGS